MNKSDIEKILFDGMLNGRDIRQIAADIADKMSLKDAKQSANHGLS